MLKPGAWEIVVGGIAVLIFGAGVYLGALITDRHHERNMQTAISNAIASCPEVTNCDTQQALETLKGMAMNGYKMEYHKLCWTSEEDSQ